MSKNLSDLLFQAMRNQMAELNHAVPGVVVSYEFATQKASVRAAIRRQYKDNTTTETPITVEVPVIFPRAGGASLTMPVLPGDTVLLVYGDRAIDTWLNSGGISNPNDFRMHDQNDAMAIPGLIPFVTGSLAENNDDVLLIYSDSKVRLKPGGIVHIETSSLVQVDTQAVEVNCTTAEVNCTTADLNASASITNNTPLTTMTGNLVINGIISVLNQGAAGVSSAINGTIQVVGGDVIADTISLKHHVHSGVQSGPSNTGEPVP